MIYDFKGGGDHVGLGFVGLIVGGGVGRGGGLRGKRGREVWIMIAMETKCGSGLYVGGQCRERGEEELEFSRLTTHRPTFSKSSHFDLIPE